MPDPPDPLVTSELLAIIARLTWRFLARMPSGLELGTLTDSKVQWYLVLARGAVPHCAEWRMMDALPARMSPWGISRFTFAVLSTGRLAARALLCLASARRAIVGADRTWPP